LIQEFCLLIFIEEMKWPGGESNQKNG